MQSRTGCLLMLICKFLVVHQHSNCAKALILVAKVDKELFCNGSDVLLGMSEVLFL